MTGNAQAGGGISLTMLFIVLKLIGVISWSWWWVLAPIWIPFVLVTVIASYLIIVSSEDGPW